MIKPDVIPNLNLMQTYDKFYDNSYIQYESLDNLATFFGRIMHLHRHDQYYQLHFIHKGTVHLQLGDKEYIETAPLIFLHHRQFLIVLLPSKMQQDKCSQSIKA